MANQLSSLYVIICRLEIVGEDEENWDTISLSSFDPTLCFTVMPFLSLYIYHIVWGYYYIMLFTILVRCNEKQCFHLLKKSLKPVELGHRKEKWYRCKWVQTVYERIYRINIQYVNKWDTCVEKWDTHWENWNVMSQFSPYMPLHIVPALPMPTRFKIHSLTQ